MLYMYYRGLLNPGLLAISLGKFSAIHDCSADKPQTKKLGGGGVVRRNVLSKWEKIRKKVHVCGTEN